jgi:phosphatidylserine/phosphatidylglycerophosphate/cardiolipin synthase-like enzyme
VDVTLNAIAGTHAVLLGFDVAPGKRKGLLGFAVQRTVARRTEWLPNFLRFARNDTPDGPTGSDENPLQAFQWGDYGVEPGQKVRYRAYAVYGKPGALTLSPQPAEVNVQTEQSDDGRNGVYFNRGIAGSQAYARKFGRGSPLGVPDALRWLSRGLEEGLLGFIAQAQDNGWALRGAFYEFYEKDVLAALKAAAIRGVDVRLVVSAPSDSADWPDFPSAENADAMRAQESWQPRKPFIRLARARTAAMGIAHNKFLVAMQGGQPRAVWTGSTNISPGAIYGHSNLGHVSRDPQVAQAFFDYWQQLDGNPDTPKLRKWVDANSPLPTVAHSAPLVPHGATAVFSPRSDVNALQRYVDLAQRADQAIFFTAPFGVTERFETEFRRRRDIPRYLLLDKRTNDMELQRASPNNSIAVGAYLGQPGGYRQFMQEYLTGLNSHVKFIHTKYMLVDPLTANPVVVTGSANFSDPSMTRNDENMLVISGDTRVADIYLTEFMRLFTHLRFRGRVRVPRDQRAPDPREPEVKARRHLYETDKWATEYFKAGTAKARERLLFSDTKIA